MAKRGGESKSETPVRRRIGRFKEIANKDRRNPQSIRRMMHDMIVRYFDSDCTTAALRIEGLRVQHKGRNYTTSITPDGLYKAVADTHYIKYYLLEAIAIERRVP